MGIFRPRCPKEFQLFVIQKARHVFADQGEGFAIRRSIIPNDTPDTRAPDSSEVQSQISTNSTSSSVRTVEPN